jgi:cell division protein FtsN
VLAILGAAVIGVAVFWLGVVIGKGQTTPAGSSEWQAAAPVGQGEQGEGDELGLSDADGEPGAGESDPEAGPGETVPPPAGPDVATADPPAQDPTATSSAGGAQAGGFQPAAPVEERRDPVVADSDRAPAAALGAGLPRPDVSLVSGWVVQVRSTPDKPAADALQAALALDGFPAFTTSVEVDGQTFYRVRVGRYGSRAEAETVERALRRHADIEDAWVTEG